MQDFLITLRVDADKTFQDASTVEVWAAVKRFMETRFAEGCVRSLTVDKLSDTCDACVEDSVVPVVAELVQDRDSDDYDDDAQDGNLDVDPEVSSLVALIGGYLSDIEQALDNGSYNNGQHNLLSKGGDVVDAYANLQQKHCGGCSGDNSCIPPQVDELVAAALIISQDLRMLISAPPSFSEARRQSLADFVKNVLNVDYR